MLTFVGLGLYDERSVTIRGREAINNADRVVAEFYTSRLPGTDIATLERFHETDIELLDREAVEHDPEPVLSAAEEHSVVFLVGGDPMISTTHVDLRLRAAQREIDTAIVHGPSAATAASSLTGLQNYRFGKATTVPFPGSVSGDDVPPSVIETIRDNQERGLHTLAYLDIDDAADAFLRADVAAELLAPELDEAVGVVVARAGSSDPVIIANRLDELAEETFGPPLHLLVLPGTLHPLEAESLHTFAGAPEEILSQR